MKRYVGESNDDGTKKKRIRTEEGTLLPASYKSGRYESWQKKQKLDEQRENASDDETESRPKFARNSRRGGGANADWPQHNRANATDANTVRSELRSKEQILKERRRKEKIQSFQSYRRRMNKSGGKRGGGSSTSTKRGGGSTSTNRRGGK